MRTSLAAIVLVTVFTLAGCGGSAPQSPEDVVRAWSDALNAGDDTKAASLFASDAEVIQAGVRLKLHDAKTAKRWNAGLPCAGKIVDTTVDGDEVTAAFELGQRPRHHCDAPGTVAYALFQVLDGKIVLWHQVPGPDPIPPTGQKA